MIGSGLQHLPDLQELHIFQNNIRLEGMNALLTGLTHCPNFRTLDIQDNFV